MEKIVDASTTGLLEGNNDFELLDYIDEANFDQFIDLIRGENEENRVSGFDCDLINGLLVDNQFGPNTGDMFDFGAAYDSNSCALMMTDPVGYAPGAMPSLEGGLEIGGEEEEDDDDDDDDDDNDGDHDSSGITTTTTTTKARKTKVDRSRILISERRRRGRMKEKLYALRSLVPNITKMDKASIIGDAALYVQELQMQAKKLKAQVAGLQASLAGSDRDPGLNKNPKKIGIPSNDSNAFCRKIIVQLDVFQVEEKEFYVRLVCIKGERVAATLYRALESLTGSTVQSSNLATTAEDRYILTFSLRVKNTDFNMNLASVKLWVAGAFLNQGFDISTSLSA